MMHAHATTATTAALITHRTPLGQVVLAATEETLVLCAFGTAEDAERRLSAAGLHAEAPSAEGPAAALLDRARTELDEYLDGRRQQFTVPWDLRLATPFSRETVQALDAFVPYGRTATYGELAAVLGRPRAARAVGTALGANPLCVVLPCHRIVGSTGKLTGYAGGTEAKRFLLGLEARG